MLSHGANFFADHMTNYKNLNNFFEVESQNITPNFADEIFTFCKAFSSKKKYML